MDLIMKFFMLALLFLGCETVGNFELKDGECIIGPSSTTWKLLRKVEKKYMFVELPESMDSQVQVLDDLSTVKKIECPNS
jgi:hypothetical protein